MSGWVAKNLGLMAFALVLAFGVWLMTTMQDDPIVEGEVFARVQVAPPARGDLLLSGSVPTTVTVRVRAPQSVLKLLNASDNALVPFDLSTLDVGRHVVPFVPQLRVNPARILSTEPPTTAVSIERIVERQFPVRVGVIGMPALGYQALEGRTDTATAVISTTESMLERIVSVDAVVSLVDVRSNLQQRVRLQARDAAGNTVPGVVISPTDALVTVPIEQLSNYRTLAVSVKTRGLPADGYAITSIIAEPQIVTVFGNKDEIQKLPGFIETLDVSVDGAIESIDDRAGLRVPTGVTLVGEDFTVRVRVRVEAQQGARTVTRAPIVIGLASDLRAIVRPEVVEVRLSGPLPQLNQLAEQDARVLLDVTGLPAGVHQVQAVLVKPDALRAELSMPTIEVELKEAPAGRQ
jgi:YbbR domain-containing protein